MFWMMAALAAPMDEVAAAAGMEVAEVEALLEGVARDDSILERMARPYEAKPWHAYRKLFLTDERIDGGRAFLDAHRALLERAQAETGVPAEVITAIIGVETGYGKTMGRDRVVTALYTLGFHHPRRGRFFRSELGHFLHLVRDQGWDRDQVLGSYAGAMGMGQFMPSSYRTYAVDFDRDGRIDLFGSVADAIGSVANYLGTHGWKPDGRVLTEDGEGKVYTFATEGGEQTLRGHENFAALLTYNRSPLYARAVWELSRAYPPDSTR